MPRGTKRTIPDTIGGRIQKLRFDKELDQKDIAEALGVKRETVNQWESETRDLKTKHTIALADYFGVTCDYILRGVQSKNVEINKRLGLNDKAIQMLEGNKIIEKSFNCEGLLSNILTSSYTSMIIDAIREYLEVSSKKPVKVSKSTELSEACKIVNDTGSIIVPYYQVAAFHLSYAQYLLGQLIEDVYKSNPSQSNK